MDKLVCIEDFRQAAKEIMPVNYFEYYNSGADDQITVQDNRDAYLRWLIRPRVLRDVSQRNLETFILGKPVSFPIGISPTAFQKVANPEGECASARAAQALGTIFTLSTFATSSIEEIAQAAPTCRKWFQLFVQTDRNATKRMLQRVEKAGFEAIVWTLDAQLVGRRRTNQRNQFHLPSHLSIANFQTSSTTNGGLSSAGLTGGMSSHVHQVLEQALTWDTFHWLKKATKLPIIVKGIYNVEDANRACEMGASAIIVSNHGGRQVDTVLPTIDLLPRIVEAISGKCDILIDGGVSRGADIFKAICLGAKMAFIGRPVIWGLAAGGESGVKKILEIFKTELDLTMALAGVKNTTELNKNYVIHKYENIKSSL